MLPLEIRFADVIQEMEAYPVETGKVLLYGSSFFTVWGMERAKQQWAEATDQAVRVVNHGFGGARVDELLHYYDRMVLPYKPSAIVFRTGINDVFHGISAEETMLETEKLFAAVKKDFPSIPLISIKVFDTVMAPPPAMDEMRKYNDLLENYAKAHENIYTIDLNPFVYMDEADIGTCRNFKDVFQPDGLHFTDAGYVKLAAYLAPIVRKILADAKVIG